MNRLSQLLALALVSISFGARASEKLPAPSARMVSRMAVVTFDGKAAELFYDTMVFVKEQHSLLGNLRLGKNMGCVRSYDLDPTYSCEMAVDAHGTSLTMDELQKLYDPRSGSD